MDRSPLRGRPLLVPLAQVVATALAEDLGEGWSVDDDVTGRATVPAGTAATALLVPRQAGVIAGLAAVEETYRQVDALVDVQLLAADGDAAVPGQAVARVAGPARAVMAGERTALNLLTHLSGIASATRRLVDEVAGTGCVVRDTRKTLPGLRLLQKEAVVAGGGANHRWSLIDGLLVKDNHVTAAGGIAQAARAAIDGAGGLPVQIEVDSLDQLDAVLGEGAERVLLDNFSVADTIEGVARCRASGRDVYIEASGSITLDTARAIAEAGVDAIAVGALTHSPGALDIGLDIDLQPASEA